MEAIPSIPLQSKTKGMTLVTSSSSICVCDHSGESAASVGTEHSDENLVLLAVVREKDVCWEYADKLDGNKVRCKFCLRVLNGGISRLKHHLSRLPSKGVNPCSKVRDDVTDRVRAILATKEEVRESPSATKKQKLAVPEAKSP
ncbi:hypothetical protein CRG98_016130, partial [Punica granatum]